MSKKKKNEQPKQIENQTGDWVVVYFGEMKSVLSVHYIRSSERYETKDEILKFMPKGCDHYELVKVVKKDFN